MENIMKELDKMEGVTYELIGTWLWVGGDTKPHKTELGEMGAHWAPRKKLWYFQPETTKKFKGNSKMDMDAIRAKYGTAAN